MKTFLAVALFVPGTALSQNDFPVLEPDAVSIVHLRQLDTVSLSAVKQATLINGCQKLARKLLLEVEVKEEEYIKPCGFAAEALNNDAKKALSRLGDHLENLKTTVGYLKHLSVGYPVPEQSKKSMRLVSVTSNPDTGDSCNSNTALNNTIVQCFADANGKLPDEPNTYCKIDEFSHKAACGHATGSGGTITVKYKCGSEAAVRTHSVPASAKLQISCETDRFKASQ